MLLALVRCSIDEPSQKVGWGGLERRLAISSFEGPPWLDRREQQAQPVSLILCMVSFSCLEKRETRTTDTSVDIYVPENG